MTDPVVVSAVPGLVVVVVLELEPVLVVPAVSSGLVVVVVDEELVLPGVSSGPVVVVVLVLELVLVVPAVSSGRVVVVLDDELVLVSVVLVVSGASVVVVVELVGEGVGDAVDTGVYRTPIRNKSA